jgi:hypothetical protein
VKQAKLVLFGLVALLLALPVSGSAAELCSAETVASVAAAPVLPLFEPAFAFPEAQPKVTWCTKEVCSAARQECREGCLPCGFQFGACNAPSCTGSCNCIC